MLFAERGATIEERVSVAVAIYAIMRTVHVARQHSGRLSPTPILRLYTKLKEGLRGSKAKAILNGFHITAIKNKRQAQLTR